MRVEFTEHAKRDLLVQRVPLEAALATLLQPDEKIIRQGKVHSTRKLAVNSSLLIVRVTHKQEQETLKVLCVSKREGLR